MKTITVLAEFFGVEDKNINVLATWPNLYRDDGGEEKMGMFAVVHFINGGNHGASLDDSGKILYSFEIGKSQAKESAPEKMGSVAEILPQRTLGTGF